MSDGDTEVTQLVGELVSAVEELQSELEPSRGPLRPPTPREMARFTSEVTIPAIILVLETNVRALRLVQRALRIAEGRDPGRGESVTRERARALGQATVKRLEDTLINMQDVLEGRPPDDEARKLLSRVRDLREELESELAAEPAARTDALAAEPGETDHDEDRAGVDVDVDAELRALKDDLDEDNSHEGDEDNE